VACIIQVRVGEQGRRRGTRPEGGLGDGHPVDPVAVARGQGAGVMAVLGLARQPAPALVMGNDLEVPR